MSDRLTDRIRSYVMAEYVIPARRQGKQKLTVSVREVRSALGKHESMRGKSVVICQALQSRKFMEQSAMVVDSIDGPPSKKSPTVVMHYELIGSEANDANASSVAAPETPEEWAARVTGKLWGLMREELSAYGGGEAFVKWVRSEEKGS